MLFGKKKPDGKTILLLDVESGSVGAALVRYEEDHLPKLFGEVREYLRTPATRNSNSLLAGVSDAAHRALDKVRQVLARVRNHPKTSVVGELAGVSIFCSAPWGTPNLATGTPLFLQTITDVLEKAVAGHIGDTLPTFHTSAGGIFGGVRNIVLQEESYLLCIVQGEVSELVLVDGGRVVGYATVPVGRHSVVRTLQSHGGHSEHEAYSLLRLPALSHEGLGEAARHYAEELADVAASLLAHSPVRNLYVVAHGGVGEWFARSLAAHEGLGELFPHGGAVRALLPRHASHLLAPAGGEPDLVLGLHALYTNSLSD